MKRVLVTNIPLDAFIEGWVEVPDDTAEDDMQEAITEAILEKGYTPKKRQGPLEQELNEGIVRGGWEWDFK